MILDREKMGYLSDLLSFFVTTDSRQHTDKHLAEAQKLARELFPPMAKPLVWVHGSSGPYSVFYDYADKVWSAGYRTHWMSNFASITEAEAGCESHHQSRFLEQLA